MSPLIEWADRRHHMTWTAMLDAVRHGETPQWSGHFASTDYEPSKHWDLGMGYDGALALASGQGEWKEGREKIETTAREQAERFVLKRGFIDYGYDVTGEYFDVPAVIEGRPECWLTPVHAGMGAPALVRLVLDLGTSAGVSAQTMRDRMIAVSAAVLTLEACGNPVEVIAVSSTTGDVYPDATFCISFQVCAPGEPVDVSRIVALAHPAFFRRCVFRLIEQTTSARCFQVYSSSYGYPDRLNETQLAHEFGSHVVYIPPCRLGNEVQPTTEALLRMVKQRAGIIGADDAAGEADYATE